MDDMGPHRSRRSASWRRRARSSRIRRMITANVGSVLVTGGAGYIGSVLVPRIVGTGRSVTVLDRCFFGRDVLPSDPKLNVVVGDIRDTRLVNDLLLRGQFDAVIHLAAVSNDPCSEIDEGITRSINRVALEEVI